MPSKQPSRATALPVTVVMGVSGSGKTDTSHAVADALGLPHIEADNFHPAENVARMRAGTPLSDTDRVQWLQALIGEMQRTLDSGSGFVWPARRSSAAIVSSCAVLSRDCASPIWPSITTPRCSASVRDRGTSCRSPVDSQFATLESPEGEPGVLTVDASQSRDVVLLQIVEWMRGADLDELIESASIFPRVRLIALPRRHR